MTIDIIKGDKMKKIFKKPIFMFILGGIVFSGIAVLASIAATSITYEPSWTKANGDPITNVKDALDELYIKKQFSSVTFVGKTTITGNTTSTYTFNEDIDLGLVIITASNNINDTSYYTADIDSLSNGNYSVLDDSATYIGGKDNLAGHRSKIYIIEGVTSGTTMQFHTRYAGQIQILKIN